MYKLLGNHRRILASCILGQQIHLMTLISSGIGCSGGMARATQHHSESKRCREHRYATLGYQWQRLPRYRKDSRYNSHVEQGLKDYGESATHHQHTGQGLLETHGELGASAKYPQIAHKDTKAHKQAHLLYYDGIYIVGKSERQTRVFARAPYTYTRETAMRLSYIAELFLLVVDREFIEMLVGAEMTLYTSFPRSGRSLLSVYTISCSGVRVLDELRRVL